MNLSLSLQTELVKLEFSQKIIIFKCIFESNLPYHEIVFILDECGNRLFRALLSSYFV